MTWYQMANDWQQFTAIVKEEWDKLTDDDLTTFGGSERPARRHPPAKIRLRTRTGGKRNHRVFT